MMVTRCAFDHICMEKVRYKFLILLLLLLPQKIECIFGCNIFPRILFYSSGENSWNIKVDLNSVIRKEIIAL